MRMQSESTVPYIERSRKSKVDEGRRSPTAGLVRQQSSSSPPQQERRRVHFPEGRTQSEIRDEVPRQKAQDCGRTRIRQTTSFSSWGLGAAGRCRSLPRSEEQSRSRKGQQLLPRHGDATSRAREPCGTEARGRVSMWRLERTRPHMGRTRRLGSAVPAAKPRLRSTVVKH